MIGRHEAELLRSQRDDAVAQLLAVKKRCAVAIADRALLRHRGLFEGGEGAMTLEEKSVVRASQAHLAWSDEHRDLNDPDEVGAPATWHKWVAAVRALGGSASTRAGRVCGTCGHWAPADAGEEGWCYLGPIPSSCAPPRTLQDHSCDDWSAPPDPADEYEARYDYAARATSAEAELSVLRAQPQSAAVPEQCRPCEHRDADYCRHPTLMMKHHGVPQYIFGAAIDGRCLWCPISIIPTPAAIVSRDARLLDYRKDKPNEWTSCFRAAMARSTVLDAALVDELMKAASDLKDALVVGPTRHLEQLSALRKALAALYEARKEET